MANGGLHKRLLFLAGIVLILLATLRFIHLGSIREAFQNLQGADTFTLYYADWCPHCQSVKPAFEEFAKNGFVTVAGKNVKVQMVQPEKEPEKAAGKPIKGYPTFLLETAQGKTVEYQGERTPSGYLEFLNKQLEGLAKAQQ
jgi:thiol-disulfide isomerase/thioredoxin